MSERIRTFIEYLLDTETTTELAYRQEIQKNSKLFHQRFLTDFVQVVHDKLEHWQHINRSGPDTMAAASATNASSAESSETESEEEQEDDNNEESSSFEGRQRKSIRKEKVRS